jgi:ribonuclease D
VIRAQARPLKIVASDGDLKEAVAAAARASRVALDVEASGMFAYRATPCTLQLAWSGAGQIVVIDVLATSIAPTQELLGPDGPVKIVHDVAFDARLLAESGIALGNVHDTSIAARMLGYTATGLAALLESQLGIAIAKTMQGHDWRMRPLDAAGLGYLAEDVAHLEALEATLWAQVFERGIEDAVLEETRYRIASAVAVAHAPSSIPPYLRIKGASRLAERELAALRLIAELREREAQSRDVPPYKVAPNEALVAIARARPATVAEVARVRGISMSSPAARAFVDRVAQAIATAEERLPDSERAYLERPRVAAGVAKKRREREARLLGWRRLEAKRRGVDEQVVLPGHCLKDAADAEVASIEQLARVRGIGSFRLHIDGEAIVQALLGDGVQP